jgi:peptidyl-prolyl cis-trans isomerase SurA
LRKLIALFAFGAFASIGWSQVDPNRVVAVVNGEEIKGAEYYRRMEFLPGTGKMLGNRFASFPPGFMTLEQIITERLVYKLAAQKRCMPTDDEIQSALTRLKADNPKIAEDWVASGRLMEDLLNQIKFERAQFKLATFGITVTDQQVDTFYKEKQDTLFTVPKRVKLRVIAVDDDAQKAVVDKALAAGTPFGKVAHDYSKDVTKLADGEFGVVPVTGLQPLAKAAIDKIKVGGVTEWISTEGKSVKFLMEEVLPSKVVPLDAKLRVDIREKLMLDKGQATNDMAKQMAVIRKAAVVDIKQKEFAEAYQKFIDSYVKQQEAKTSGGS